MNDATYGEYPLTLEHIKQYLATKQDNEEIGICNNAMCCLLAEVLNFTYPIAGRWRVDYGTYQAQCMYHNYELNPELKWVRSAFDFTMFPTMKSIVTKADFRAWVAHYYTEECTAMPESRPSFDFADLFE